MAWLDLMCANFPLWEMDPRDLMNVYKKWATKAAKRQKGRQEMPTPKPAAQLAEEGAKRAAMHANRVHGDFTDKALLAFRAYAWTHKEFTTEDVRAAFCDAVPPAPDNRAWGHVARMAVRDGICKRVRIAPAKARHCHGTWVSVYESLSHYSN